MRVFIMCLILALSSQLTFSQSVCGIKEFKDAVDKVKAESKRNDSVNDAKYRKALSQLSKIKKWNSKQELSYEIKLIGMPVILVCEKNKQKFAKEMIECMMKVNEKVIDENNCKATDLSVEKLRLMMNENAKEFQIMLERVIEDYKQITQKDLVIE